jgi:hypothetical protein
LTTREVRAAELLPDDAERVVSRTPDIERCAT